MVNLMFKNILLCSALALSACSSGDAPFGGSDSDDDSGSSETDGGSGGSGTGGGSGSSASPTELYVGDDNDMNSLVYDAEKDELVINNLPFDGVEGRYVNTGGSFLDGFQVYASQQAGEDGHQQYYAVHAMTENGHAGAAGTDVYRDYGYGGAMIARNSSNIALPVGRGELLYTGSYAGIRVSQSQSGDNVQLTLADGDAEVWVDLRDFDVTGSTYGGVDNRSEYDVSGNLLGTLEAIVLDPTSISSTGVISGNAETNVPGTITTLQSGDYTAIFAGPEGEQIIGTIRITGDISGFDADLGTVQETGVFVVTD